LLHCFVFFDHLIVIALHGSKHWSKLKSALCLGLPKTSMDCQIHFFDMTVVLVYICE
jgi:hypothetical protein